MPLLGLTGYLTEFWVIRRGNFAASITYPLLRHASDLLGWLFTIFDLDQIFEASSRVTERLSEPAKAEADAFARVGVEREGPWTISISLACGSMSSRPM